MLWWLATSLSENIIHEWRRLYVLLSICSCLFIFIHAFSARHSHHIRDYMDKHENGQHLSIQFKWKLILLFAFSAGEQREPADVYLCLSIYWIVFIKMNFIANFFLCDDKKSIMDGMRKAKELWTRSSRKTLNEPKNEIKNCGQQSTFL